MRWFTEITSARMEFTRLIDDLELYQSFNQGRAGQHRALRLYYDAGLTLRDIIVRSSGLQPDANFIGWSGPSDVVIDHDYILVCSDCDPAPSPAQTKQIPPSVWREIIDRLLHIGAVVEVGLRIAPGYEHRSYINLCGRTTVLEWASLILHAKRILTIEGGTAHLAAVLRRPATVICGPTDARVYGHSLHKYIDSGICTPCHWTTDRWFERCALGNSRACMHGLDPDWIVERALNYASPSDR